MKYDLRKSGGLGSSSQFLELWRDGEYLARNADAWNLLETLTSLPAGRYEIRQPTIYATVTEETQTQTFDVTVGVGI